MYSLPPCPQPAPHPHLIHLRLLPHAITIFLLTTLLTLHLAQATDLPTPPSPSDLPQQCERNDDHGKSEQDKRRNRPPRQDEDHRDDDDRKEECADDRDQADDRDRDDHEEDCDEDPTYPPTPPSNPTPTALAQSIQTPEDLPIAILLTADYPGPDTLSFTITSPPTNGLLTGTPPSLQYLPNPNYNGTDVFSFTAIAGTTPSKPEQIQITITPVNDPPSVSTEAPAIAQVHQPFTLTAIITDDADPNSPTLLHSWTKASGPAPVAITNPQAPITTATATQPGTYTFLLSATDSNLTTTNLVEITILDSLTNLPPTVSAGPDLTLSGSTTTQLHGQASDPTSPDSSPLQFQWSQIHGPSPVTLSHPTNLLTTVTFPTDGTYEFNLTASDGQFSASDNLLVTVHTTNAPPTVNAGPDQQLPWQPDPTSNARRIHHATGGRIVVCNDDWTLSDRGFTVTSSASRFALNLANWFTGHRPGSFLVYTDNFGLTGNLLATTLRAAGHQWTINPELPFAIDLLLPYDAIWIIGKEVNLDVLRHYVRSGGSLYLGAGTRLSLPGGEVPYWNSFLTDFGLQLSPTYHGVNRLESLHNNHPTLLNVESLYIYNGNYVAETQPDNPATQVFGTSPETGLIGIYDPHQATTLLQGHATDDGLPTSTLELTWTQTSGPTNAIIQDPTQASTRVSFPTPGHYTFTLTASDSILSSSDYTSISVTEASIPSVNAGPNLQITLPQTAQLSAATSDPLTPTNQLTSQWTAIQAPAPVSFSHPTSPETQATFSAPGRYTLQITTANPNFQTSDQIQVDVFLPPQPLASSRTLWLPFDNTLTDLTGSLTAQSDQPPTFAPGLSDKALLLSATQPGPSIQNTPLILPQNSTDGFTLEAWVKPATPPSSAPLLSFASTNNLPTLEWWLHNPVLGGMSAAFRTTTGTTRILTTPYNRHPSNPLSLQSDTFQHVALSYNPTSGTATLYLNGLVAAQSNFGTLNLNLHQPLWIGRKPNDPALFNGLIDELAIHPHPLSPTELTTIVHAGPNGGDKTLTVHAGPSLAAEPGQPIQLHATLSGTPLSQGEPVSVLWSITPSTEAGNLTPTNSTTTSFIPASPGSYTLTCSASTPLQQAQDSLTITVVPPGTLNQPPSVNAGPHTTAWLHLPFTPTPEVTDDLLPSNTPLQYQWTTIETPGPVSFSNTNTLHPTLLFSAPGHHTLRLTASDSQLSTSAELTIQVIENSPPSLTLPSPITTLSPATTLTISATDDGLPHDQLALAWSQTHGPAPATIHSPSSPSTDVTLPAQGTYIFEILASDGQRTTRQPLPVTYGSITNTPPTANAGPNQTIALNQPAHLTPTVLDDGLPFGTLTHSWTQLNGPTNSTITTLNGQTSATFTQTGSYTFELTASDNLATTTDLTTIHVIHPINPPETILDSSNLIQPLTAPTPISGTLASPNLHHWQLDYRTTSPTPSPWTTFATGTNTPASPTLGTFDPTTLPNGTYEISLAATDALGQTTRSTPTPITISGHLKPGLLNLSFQDYTLPLPNLPITITRRYNSLNARHETPGDFGAGWSLDLHAIEIQLSSPLHTGWQSIQSGPYYAITPSEPKHALVRLPNGDLLSFTPQLSPNLQFGLPITSPSLSFTNLPGTTAQLSLAQPLTTQTDGYLGPINLLYPGSFSPINPTTFLLTTRDGTQYTIDLQHGLQHVREPNGHELSIQPSGIHHSSGWSIPFTRNDQGLITHITTPSGRQLQYDYDNQNNLIAFSPDNQNTQTLRYDNHHQLLAVLNPDGTTLIENAFDPAGRLITQTDANGNSTTYAHDLPNRREIITDSLGHTTTHLYDNRGNVLQIINALGETTTLEYDSQDNLIAETDALGHRTSHSYDNQNNRTSTTSPLGHTTTFQYDSANHLTRLTNPLGHTLSFEYDSHGNLIAEIDPTGAITSHSYNPQGLRTSTTTPTGHTTTFEYNSSSLLTRIINPLGHEETFAYQPDGLLSSHTTYQTLPDNTTSPVTTSFLYDNLDRPQTIIQPDGTTLHASYNQFNQPETITDPLQQITRISYTPTGHPLIVTLPDNSTRSTLYNQQNQPVATTDPEGRTTHYTRDALGRVITTIAPDGTTTHQTFNAAGQLSSTTDAIGNTTHFTYDPDGNRTAITNALGHITRYTYNAAGQLNSVTDPNGNTTLFTHDPAGRLITTTRPDGSTIHIQRNAAGLPTQITDPNGANTFIDYTPLGDIAAITNALGQITRYTYDQARNLTSRTLPRGNTTLFTHDHTGRLTSRTTPLGHTEYLQYDPAGRLLTHTDFNGLTTTFEYDPLDRLITRQPDPRSQETPTRFTYTPAGRRTAMHDPSGSTHYTYTTNGLLESLTRTFPPTPSNPAWSASVHHAYNANGTLQSITSGQTNGSQVSYEYNALNQLVAVHDPRLGTTHYTYDPAGNLIQTELPNGTTQTRQYDSLNRPLAIQLLQSNQPIAEFKYSRDPNGRRTNATEYLLAPAAPISSTHTYAYDPLGQLIKETYQPQNSSLASILYNYDPNGNRLQRLSSSTAIPPSTTTYSDEDLPTHETFDPNGNPITASSPYGEPLHCSYNTLNQLILASLPDGRSISYTYDGDGQRWSRTLTLPTGNSLTTWLIPAPVNPTGWPQTLEELHSLTAPTTTPEITRAYTWGLHLISQDQLLNQQWTPTWFAQDAHNNSRLLLDPLGNVTDAYTYDAFGNLLAAQGTTPNLNGFAGEYLDPELGLYYLRARHLNPNTGRFWTRDPFPGHTTDPLSQHPYLYGNNDPVNTHDPSGYLTLAEARVTTGIASIIHSMAIYHGTDTLLRGQHELAQVGLAGPELYDAIETVLIYQLITDSIAGFNLARSIPALTRFSLAKASYALNRLSHISPKQWLQLKLSSPPHLTKPISQAETLVSLKGTTTAQLEFPFVNQLGPRPKPVYPQNYGFEGSSSTATLVPGSRIDRYGQLNGRYASPEGTPFIMRSLPASSAQADYHVLEVLSPIDVEAGAIAPWFGMPGGGIQYRLPTTVDDLVAKGYLRRIDETLSLDPK